MLILVSRTHTHASNYYSQQISKFSVASDNKYIFFLYIFRIRFIVHHWAILFSFFFHSFASRTCIAHRDEITDRLHTISVKWPRQEKTRIFLPFGRSMAFRRCKMKNNQRHRISMQINWQKSRYSDTKLHTFHIATRTFSARGKKHWREDEKDGMNGVLLGHCFPL